MSAPNPSRQVDLNADLGESYGAWRMGDDEALLEIVSSCNIACGFHAGDPQTMARTVDLAVARGVALGAHPSLPDLVGFGRREMAVSPSELHALTLYQVAALNGFARARGAALHHVKPHGALYAMLQRDVLLARAFAAAVASVDGAAQIYGPPTGELKLACGEQSLTYVAEGFADRGYCPDATLVPRSAARAHLNLADALQQGLALALGQPVHCVGGERICPSIQSLCVHGDGVHALELARQLRGQMLAAGLTVRAP